VLLGDSGWSKNVCHSEWEKSTASAEGRDCAGVLLACASDLLRMRSCRASLSRKWDNCGLCRACNLMCMCLERPLPHVWQCCCFWCFRAYGCASVLPGVACGRSCLNECTPLLLTSRCMISQNNFSGCLQRVALWANRACCAAHAQERHAWKITCMSCCSG